MTKRTPYAQASKLLLRNTLLDGLRELLTLRDWSKVTMADVAKHAGLSRQTVYNEFGSRHGLAQAYALRLVEVYTAEIGAAVDAHENDLDRALVDGFVRFFTGAATDPMIASLLSGEANPDLHRLITTDAAPLIAAAKTRLTEVVEGSWIAVPADKAERIAGAIARMALSYVAMPPEVPAEEVAANLAAIFGPAIRETSEG
ncbi:MAG: TetR family transcriptional regulator [Gordonia sp. (in: high G+C Gram-positive bacteria)]|uniref:TetR/AcrR family transcriptional regulator n=1 Tax=Gordonia sp. (in: high G+C Gram-positive bacteria) TaxID=84139 RepID=UPI0039E3263D